MQGGRRTVALAVVTTAAVLIVASCRDGDDAPPATTLPSTRQTLDRVAAWFVTQTDPNGMQFDDDEADCAAERVVDGLGVARIEELRTEAANEVGSPPEGLDLLQQPPLDDAEADLVYEAMTACIDFTAQVTEVLVGAGQTPEDARCMAERYIDTDVPRKAIMAARTSPELTAEINQALATVAAACDN
jgi:hypothetical protein